MEDAAPHRSFDRRQAALARLGLLLIAGVVSWAAWERSFHAVAWPDECIYLVSARNVIERGTLDTNFYLTHSLLRQGYPHRDPHMPGYVLSLVPFVRWLGPTLAAAVALNLAAYLASILLVFEIGRSLIGDHRLAAVSAALAAIVPPVPGFLFVAYAEMWIVCLLLAGLALSLRVGGTREAFAAGFFFGLGGLVRETLLVALPLHLLLLRARSLWRAFVSGFALALLLVVVPLSGNRADYPGGSIVDDLLTSPPAAGHNRDLWGLSGPATRVAANVRHNVRDVLNARPGSSAEDATLVFLGTLAGMAVLALPALAPRARSFLLLGVSCLAALVVAAFALYVVRERQGTWAGVRLFMPWAPVLLPFAVTALASARRRSIGILAILTLAGSMLWLDSWQLYTFFRYKQADHEDQARYAAYVQSRLDRLAPTRVVGRLFLYGYQRYPVEVVWSLPRDGSELRALERAVPFDYVVLHWRSRLREALVRNPRYVRLNKDDRDAELLIWRRLE